MSTTHEIRKLVCPVLPPTILQRESLVERLHRLIAGSTAGFPHYKLVLLYAPAGYGKTTLLADFAHRTSIASCWYFLDRSDTDKTTFLENLLASIRYRFPHFGVELDPLLGAAIAADADGQKGQHYEAVVDALAAAMEREISERFVIFLCNYQEVNENQSINALVNRLLRNLPTQCVLVLESRATPDLEFASLLAHREMVGIGSNLLCFSAQEIRDLAQLQGVAHLSDAEAEQLATSFDGWITGILLGTHLGDMQFLQQQSAHHSGKQGLQADRQHLFSYVVNEVFKRNPEVYAFLKEASVLQEMVPVICAELWNIDDAAERLKYLESNGLFVTRRGEGLDSVYLCHPVLRELLYEELQREAPEHFRQLHLKSAELFGTNKDYEKAVYHALEAGESDVAARFVIDAHEQMLAQGHTETLVRWIDRLPTQTTMHYPRVMLIRAHIYLVQGDHTNALALLDTVSQIISRQPAVADEDEIDQLRLESMVLRCAVLFRCSEYHQVQSLCQQILAALPADEVKLRAKIHYSLGVSSNLLGDFTTGIAQLQKALQLWGRHATGRQAAEVHSALASAYSLLGNFALAEHHISRAIACWDQLHDQWGKINNIIRLGLIKQRQGALSDAENAFIEALTLARGAIQFLRGQAYALVNLGELYQDQGQYEKSLAMIEDGLALARRIKDKYLVNCTLCILAMTYLYMGDATTATVLVAEVDVQDEGEHPGYEQVVFELARSTILLYQHQYDETYKRLSEMHSLLNTIGLKREHIQVLLRMAVCLCEQRKIQVCIRCMEEIVVLLQAQNSYEYLVLLELRRWPHLYQVVESQPEMASLRNILKLAGEPQETTAPVEPESVSPLPLLTVMPQPGIVIRALGEPMILFQDRPVTRWRMARSMELFFFLLDCGRPMRKEQIITALWSEVDDQINQTFHSTIYYLRKALEVPCVISRAGTYTLDLTAQFGEQVWYDVSAFQHYQATAKEALNQEDDDSLKEALLAMVDLYRGDYAQPFYSNWCSFRRDELRLAYLDCRRQLAHLAWRTEQFDESMTHWQHMLAVDNCLEDAHYGLMRCYVRQNKRGLALRQYQRCREILQRELAVQPGNAIQNLYQRLMGTS